MLWTNGLEFLGIKDEEQFVPEDRKKKVEDGSIVAQDCLEASRQEHEKVRLVDPSEKRALQSAITQQVS